MHHSPPRFFPRFATGLAASIAMITIDSPSFAGNSPHAPHIEVAFVLDTTGSMVELIDGAKAKIWSIANTIVDINPDADIRMALIAYRDKGDDYVVKTFDMSADVQGLYGNLIKLEANGGGDTAESVNEALDGSIRHLSWTAGEQTKRLVFLVGDAPPHMDYSNAPQYPQTLKAAQQKAITVNAVQAGADPETARIWREIAQLGHGRYIAIPQDGGRITVLETPFDGEIINLQQKIDRTVIPYGDRAKQSELRSKMETKAAAPASVQADNSSYYSKKGGPKEVVTGGGDLVADIKNGGQTLDAVNGSELPELLRGKSKGEMRAFVDEQTSKREKLEDAMSVLVKKRDNYVAEQAAKSDKTNDSSSFDVVVKETLRQQVK